MNSGWSYQDEYPCHHCSPTHKNLVPHTTKITLQNLPEYLVIQLDRMDPRTLTKITSSLVLPQDGLQFGNAKYQLTGYTTHVGTGKKGDGHYMTFVKTGQDDWPMFYRINDLEPTSKVISQDDFAARSSRAYTLTFYKTEEASPSLGPLRTYILLDPIGSIRTP